MLFRPLRVKRKCRLSDGAPTSSLRALDAHVNEVDRAVHPGDTTTSGPHVRKLVWLQCGLRNKYDMFLDLIRGEALPNGKHMHMRITTRSMTEHPFSICFLAPRPPPYGAAGDTDVHHGVDFGKPQARRDNFPVGGFQLEHNIGTAAGTLHLLSYTSIHEVRSARGATLSLRSAVRGTRAQWWCNAGHIACP